MSSGAGNVPPRSRLSGEPLGILTVGLIDWLVSVFPPRYRGRSARPVGVLRLDQPQIPPAAAHDRPARDERGGLDGPRRHRRRFPSEQILEALTAALLQIDFSAVVMDGMLAFLLFAGSLHVDLGRLAQPSRAGRDPGHRRHARLDRDRRASRFWYAAQLARASNAASPGRWCSARSSARPIRSQFSPRSRTSTCRRARSRDAGRVAVQRRRRHRAVHDPAAVRRPAVAAATDDLGGDRRTAPRRGRRRPAARARRPATSPIGRCG